MNSKETTYTLKHVGDLVYIEKLYWDENEEKPSEKQKAKRLVIGKLGDPFFSPSSWIKKLMD